MSFVRSKNRFASTTCVVAVLSMLLANRVWGEYSNRPVYQNDDWPAHQDDDDGEFGALLLFGAAVAATAPFWGPLVVTGDDYSERGYFSEYPYKHGTHGNMMMGATLPTEPYDWSLQAKTAYAENFGRFGRLDTSFQLEGSHRIGIDSEFNYWRESVARGRNHNFWTGDANLMFRFAQSEWLQTRAGLGGAWLEDGADSDYGFNFTYKADLFIRDPLILSGEIDWGTLGDETLFHPRVTLGAQWHRAELFLGCDYFDIGTTQVTSMIVGGRFWY